MIALLLTLVGVPAAPPAPDPRVVAFCEARVDEATPRGLRRLVPEDAVEQCVRREAWWIDQLGRIPDGYEDGGR